MFVFIYIIAQHWSIYRYYINGIIAILAQVYCCLSTKLATLSTVLRVVLVLRRAGWNMMLRIQYVEGTRAMRGGLASYSVCRDHYLNNDIRISSISTFI